MFASTFPRRAADAGGTNFNSYSGKWPALPHMAVNVRPAIFRQAPPLALAENCDRREKDAIFVRMFWM